MRKQEFNSKHLPSPARRGSRSRTASPPASLAIRKAPSASVESIEPRPPRPCEVGRPKGRRRKSRRQSHKFFKHRRSGLNPVSDAEKVSTTDPDAILMTKGGGTAMMAYYDNYLVDAASRVIVEVEATP